MLDVQVRKQRKGKQVAFGKTDKEMVKKLAERASILLLLLKMDLSNTMTTTTKSVTQLLVLLLQFALEVIQET